MSSELRDLRDKYLRIRALRRARELDLSRGAAHVPSRDALRALSSRWPGALAELDRLAPEVVEERIAALDRAIDHHAPLPGWARGWLLVHRALRGALVAKRFLRGARVVDGETRRAFEASLAACPWPAEARAWIDRLDEIASPPRGRILELVFADAAAELGVPADEVRALLMPRPA